MYIAGTGNQAVRRVVAATGVVTSWISMNERGFATQRVLARPNGDIYFIDYSNSISSYNGTGTIGGISFRAVAPSISFTDLAYDAVTDTVVAFAAPNQDANTGQVARFPMDLTSFVFGSRGSARYPPGIAVNPNGNTFVAGGKIQTYQNEIWSDYNDGSTAAANDVDATKRSALCQCTRFQRCWRHAGERL
uniref:Uncharacterized protein n=1 Tax=Tetradesmus obliquus TaxID=3088 RepID=A0A383V627_TETOB|eukprot:jgi/Sobl393_1/14961/SZX60423.1